MAVTFSLTSTGLTTIDFTSATDFVFQNDYYVPVVITPTGDGSIPPYVTETLPVMVNGTSDNDLALTMQELAALQKRAAEYWVDQQQAVPVLLNCKLDLETTGRQAHVKAIHFEWKPSIHPMYRECSIPPGWALGTVLIERHPYWERPIARAFPNETPAAAAAVAYDYTALGLELLSNIGFETAGGGGVDIWASWTEDAGDGALANEGVIVHGGADACKMTAGATAATFVYQAAIPVIAEQQYAFSFYARGDGTNAGRYDVYDETNAAYIISLTSTGVTAAAYALVDASFTAPAGCATIRILLRCPEANGGICYFDDTTLRLAAHDIVGDVPARIGALTIRCPQAQGIQRLWMGIRSATLHGATGVTAFRPIWELETSTINADASVYLDAEANASGAGNNTILVDPGFGGSGLDWDADYQHVGYISATAAGYANLSDSFGRFLWLLRAKVTAGEWRAIFRSGYETARNYHDPVAVTNGLFDYHEVGVATLPPYDQQSIALTTLEHNSFFHITAKRISGAGDLFLDCLCPIPVDEGFVKVWEGGASPSRDIVVGEGPHEHTQVLTIWAGAPDLAMDVDPYEFENFRLSPGDGRVICVYARTASSTLADQIEFGDTSASTATYVERWSTLRGAE